MCDLPPVTDLSSLPRINFSKFLTRIDLSTNHVTQSIFPWLFNYSTSLEWIELSDNQLGGSIPDASGNMNSIQTLYLDQNQLEGGIPKFFGNMCALQTLSIENNKLSGQLAELILNLSGCVQYSLKLLSLDGNQMKGPVPKSIGNLSVLVSLQLGSNLLAVSDVYMDGTQVTFKIISGGSSSYVFNTIVSWKGQSYVYGKNFGEMRSIDLSSNKLTGEISAEIFNLTELKALNLAGNMLTEPIPQEIGRLEQLESLDLSRNQLFGSIPASIADLKFLSFLNLSYNKLWGRIPTGTQIQTINSSGFIGNLELCGPPLTLKCLGDAEPNAESPKSGSKNNQEDEDEFLKCLYIGMGLGFMVGFGEFVAL
ncbi:receptor-like protein eix2 [Quercus suber]|uniref:Receptor-like protein eix2 n=1 Tax=Quercus suber TaxID=58331 RepID=A0AAW0KLW7_QUESU